MLCALAAWLVLAGLVLAGLVLAGLVLAWPVLGWAALADPVDLTTISLAITCAACCWKLPVLVSAMLAAWATSRVVWFRLSRVVLLVSKNFGCRAICPVTLAPASVAAALIPLTTWGCAPGSVTISTRWPGSRSRSTA